MGRPIKFTILLYLLFSMSLHGQSPEYQRVFVDTDNFGESYLDDLRDAYSKVTNNDTLQYSILNDLSYYWHTRNLKKAIQYTEMGLQLTTLNSDTLWHGRFQITQGAILLRMEKLDSAQTVLEEAMAKVPERDLAFLNTQMGYVYERRGQLDKAAGYVLESLRLGNLFQDKKAIALAYSDLSNIFWKQSKFIKGLEYGLKAINLFEERGINDLDYDFTLYVVGNNYLMLQEYDNALKFYDHAKAIGERYGFYNNLSDIYISLVELYCSLDNYEAAEKAGKNAIKYAKLLDNNFLLMRAYLSVGKLQNLQGKYSSAIESLQESIEVATENFGDEYYLSQAYEALGKALAGNHNYREAYKAFSEYDKLKKIVFNAESDQRIALLQTEFDVA
ncbi:MAG: histidine kinase, partial [Arenibacter sp.]|nr:histidine kinase [Arenibacter sp.]